MPNLLSSILSTAEEVNNGRPLFLDQQCRQDPRVDAMAEVVGMVDAVARQVEEVLGLHRLLAHRRHVRDGQARARAWPSLTLPSAGHKVFRRWTMWRTKSGNLLTGPGIWTNDARPSSSARLSQAAIVSASTRNTRAVCARGHPRAALSSRMAIRSVAG